jgi:hypothetical protein
MDELIKDMKVFLEGLETTNCRVGGMTFKSIIMQILRFQVEVAEKYNKLKDNRREFLRDLVRNLRELDSRAKIEKELHGHTATTTKDHIEELERELERFVQSL